MSQQMINTPISVHRSRSSWWVVAIYCLFYLLYGNSIAHAAEGGAPSFQRGERLVYQISWSFIPAAYATLEVAAVSDEKLGEGTYHFILTAKTLPVIDMIYRFRERVDSFVTADLHHSLLYKKVQESSHPRDIVVRFDWDRKTAQYTNFDQVSEPISIQSGTLDPLSALYYVRVQPQIEQSDLEQWVTDGKTLSRGQAIFIGREIISIRGKRYQTIKIEPDLKGVKGVFEKSPGAKMFIWLTDDEKRVLVKLQSKVAVGSFVAELIVEESTVPGVEVLESTTPHTGEIMVGPKGLGAAD